MSQPSAHAQEERQEAAGNDPSFIPLLTLKSLSEEKLPEPSFRSQSSRTSWSPKDSLLSEHRPLHSASSAKISGFKIEEKKKVKAAFRAFILYIIFLVLFSIIALVGRGHSSDLFLMSSQVKAQTMLQTLPFNVSSFQRSYMNVTNKADFYNFMRSTLIPTFLPSVSKSNTSDVNPSTVSGSTLISAIRLRQLRVTEDNDCAQLSYRLAFLRLNLGVKCYPSYTWGVLKTPTVSKKAYGAGPANSTLYSYTSSADDDASDALVYGIITVYDASGFIVDLPNTNISHALSIVNKLNSTSFIDKSTRAIVIDINTYTSNSYILAVTRLLVEFTASGFVVTSGNIRTLPLFMYLTSVDYFILACEILLIVFVIGYFAQEVYEMAKRKKGYFRSWWNLIDWINLICFAIVIGFRVAALLFIDKTDFQPGPNKHLDLESLAFYFAQEANVMAFNGFLMFIKVFKYIVIFPRLTTLARTIQTALPDLIVFFFIFFITFVGFVEAAYIAMGRENEAFHTLPDSMSTMISAVFRGKAYSKITSGNRVLGPIVYYTFMVSLYFVLASMFVAIMIHAHKKTKDSQVEETEGNKMLRKMIEASKEFFNRVLSTLSSRRAQMKKWKQIVTQELSLDGDLGPDQIQAIRQGHPLDSEKLIAALRQYGLSDDDHMTSSQIATFLSDVQVAESTIGQKVNDVEAKKGQMFGASDESSASLLDDHQATINTSNSPHPTKFGKIKKAVSAIRKMDKSIKALKEGLNDDDSSVSNLNVPKGNAILASLNEDLQMAAEAVNAERIVQEGVSALSARLSARGGGGRARKPARPVTEAEIVKFMLEKFHVLEQKIERMQALASIAIPLIAAQNRVSLQSRQQQQKPQGILVQENNAPEGPHSQGQEEQIYSSLNTPQASRFSPKRVPTAQHQPIGMMVVPPTRDGLLTAGDFPAALRLDIEEDEEDEFPGNSKYAVGTDSPFGTPKNGRGGGGRLIRGRMTVPITVVENELTDDVVISK